MALFTDGPPSAIEDLAALDSQLLAVAGVEGIDVTQKLRLAHEDLAIELSGTLRSLNRIAVTPALKLWHTCRTLEMFYADAYNSQLNDRYAGRRDQFHHAARTAYDRLLRIGLGIVNLPVPQAAAPSISAVTGSPLPDGTYYAAIAWTNRLGEEGAASPAIDIAIASNTILVEPGEMPANAAGWNVFIGSDPGGLIQQNSSPIPTGQSWRQNDALTLAGRKPGSGQAPGELQPMPRIIPRG